MLTVAALPLNVVECPWNLSALEPVGIAYTLASVILVFFGAIYVMLLPDVA